MADGVGSQGEISPGVRAPVALPGLFALFFRVGLVAFGPAMLPEMKRQLLRRNWLHQEDFLQGLALAQILPGATFVSLAVYVGTRLQGPAGGLAAWAGLLSPAFAAMLAVSYAYFTYGNLPGAAATITALGAVVVALVANATVDIGRTVVENWRGVLLAATGFAAALLRINFPALLALGVAGGLWFFRAPPCGTNASAATRRSAFPLPALVLLALALGFLAAVAGFFPPLLDLAAAFFKIGFLVFGNGYTMLPFIQEEAVNVHHWISVTDFAAGVAFGQVTPGPVVITAAFIGYGVSGVQGATAATVSVFAPTLFLVWTALPLQARLRASPWVRAGEKGLLTVFVGLMLSVVLGLARHFLTDWLSILVALAALTALRLTRLAPLWIVVAGVASYLILGAAVELLS